MSFKQKSPLVIREGGTNTQSFSHVFGVAYYDGGGLNNIDPGLATYVLTSNGASAPSFQPASGSSGVTTIDGDAGSMTGTTVTISGGATGLTTSASGASMSIVGVLLPANGGTGTNAAATSGHLLIGNGTTYTSAAPTSGTGITVGLGAGTMSVSTSALLTATSSSGTATASSNNISFVGASGISTSATGSTVTITGSGVTQGIVTIDGSTGSMTGTTVTINGGTTGLTTVSSGASMSLGGTLVLANGGTNASLTASNGGIFYSTASAGAILSGTATARQMLQSGSSTTPAWSTTTWPATTTASQLLYSSSTSVVGEVTAGNYGVLISSSSGVPSWLANGTTGQVLTATTSGIASWAAPSASGFTWNNVTGATQAMAVGNGYIGNDGATLVTMTLPAVAAVGQLVAVQGNGTGLWQIAQNASQSISFNGGTSTVGTGGFIASTSQYDSVTLICTVANNGWVANQSMGNITVS